MQLLRETYFVGRRLGTRVNRTAIPPYIFYIFTQYLRLNKGAEIIYPENLEKRVASFLFIVAQFLSSVAYIVETSRAGKQLNRMKTGFTSTIFSFFRSSSSKDF